MPSTTAAGGTGLIGISNSGDFSQSGLVVSQCLVLNAGSAVKPILKLTLFDPATGKVVAVRSVSLGDYVETFCTVGSSGPQRAQFDSTYDRMAVVIPTTGEGGTPGTHVGFIDLQTGKLTDITARRVKPGGFSTLSAQDMSPAFGPGNTFWFYSSGETIHYYTADLDSAVSTEQPQSSVPTALCWVASSYCRDFTGSEFGHTGTAINPTGTAVFEGNGNHLYLAPDWPDVAAALSCDQVDICSNAGISNCPQWLDDYRLLCDGGVGRPTVVTFSTGYRHATGRFLLPENDRNNMLPVASPDRSSIAFASSRKDGPRDWSIYRAPLAGGSEPTRVGDLPVDDLGVPATLIEWK